MSNVKQEGRKTPSARNLTDEELLRVDKGDVTVTSNRVYDWLRDEIAEGRYGPGARVTEAEVAGALEVSRTPVREAIRQLELDDLLQVEPYRGAIVSPITQEDIAIIFDLRAVLEGFCAERAAQLMPEPEILSLRRSLDEQERVAQSLHGEERLQALVRMNLEFHELIVVGSRISRIRSFFRNLTDVPVVWKSQFWNQD